MAARLYIIDRFITNLDDLKILVEEVGDDPTKIAGKQLIAAACDGLLERWQKDYMAKGESDIIVEATKIASLKGDNERWKFIKQKLIGKVSDNTFSLQDKIELVNEPDEEELDKLAKGENAHIEFKLRCKEMLDERISLRLLDSVKELDMNKQNVQTISFDLFPKGEKMKKLKLFVDKGRTPFWSTELGENIYKVGNVRFKMILVKGGTFKMTTTDGYGNQSSQKVTLSDYYIGETVVTQELWAAVMGENPSEFQGDKLPVESFSWEQGQSFLKKLSSIIGKKFRLPREAEWEFAACGGCLSKNFLYSGSDRINDVAWYERNSEDKTHPVKQKAPNELGIYDMSGNVYECCQIRRLKNLWFTDRQYRYRGGGYNEINNHCSVKHILNNHTPIVGSYIGLRLVFSP